MAEDIRDSIHANDMSKFQISAVTICLAINMLDGFDVLAIAFTASEISREWGLAASELGILFSAALAGMTLGSIFIAPFADTYGRRPLILICLAVISAGMLLSATAGDVMELAGLRVLTGLGIGGILASLNTMVSEYSSDRRREFAITLLQTGYPIGATIGGIISAFLIMAYGWRSVFIFGGIIPFLMLFLVYAKLPESLEFLISKRPAGALDKVNNILAKMGLTALEKLPEVRKVEEGNVSFKDIVTGNYMGRTAMIWLSFFLVMFSFYFVLSWTPKVLVSEGLSVEGGISGGVLLNVGGIVGALLMGALSARIAMRKLVGAYMILTAASMALFGITGPEIVLLMVIAFIVGFFIFGSIIGLYAVVPELYPTDIRTAGTGWAIGFGRLGAIAGPYVAGLMIEGGWDRAGYYAVLALPLLVSAYVITQTNRDKKHKAGI